MNHNTVYKITNRINGKFYIGVHATDDLDDGYMGSGIVIKRAIEKYGIDSFDKVVLFDYDNYDAAIQMETLLVDEIMINQSDCYNMRSGGMGGSDKGWKMSDEAKIKMSNILKGRPSHRKGKTEVYSDETLEKMSKSHSGQNNAMYGLKGEDHPAFGNILSDKTKERMSKAAIKRCQNPGYKQKLSKASKGRKHSEETKAKLSRIAKIRNQNPEFIRKLSESCKITNSGEGNGMYGKRHSDETKKRMGLIRKMYFATNKGDIDLVIGLQSQYKDLVGIYHPKYSENVN